MKHLFLAILLLGLASCASTKNQSGSNDTRSPSSAGDEDEVSSFAKGILCRAIEEEYGNKMVEKGERPKWLTCREEGLFSQNEDSYKINTPTNKGVLRCTATLESGSSRNPSVEDLNCMELMRKR